MQIVIVSDEIPHLSVIHKSTTKVLRLLKKPAFRLVNNNSTDSTLGAFAGGVGVGSSTGKVVMVNNTFIENSAVASDTAVGGGRIQAGGDITLINNVFVGNLVDTGSEASCAGGFSVFSTSGDLVITNNTFTLNSCIDGTIGGGLLASVFSDDSVVKHLSKSYEDFFNRCG